jgi:hypothetical protein
MRSSKAILLLLLSGLALVGPAASAAASTSPAQYVIASTDVSYTSSSTASATFTVSLINLTNQNAPVSVSAPGSCLPPADLPMLSPATEQAITVTLRGCAAPFKGSFQVALTVGGQALPLLMVTPAAAGAAPDWRLFIAFPVAGFIALVALFTVGCYRYRDDYKGKIIGGRSYKFISWWRTYPLNLSTSWSLKDSWGSNVTVIGAAFAGVFGSSDVLTAVLGNDTDPVFALSIVSSAVAVGIVGAAPLVLTALRVHDSVTPLALLAGASLTVAAAGGELAVITLGASDLSLGGVQDGMLPALAVGTLILLVYSCRTMSESLRPKLSSQKKEPTKQPDAANADKYDQIKALADAFPNDYLPDIIGEAYEEPILSTSAGGRRSAVF